MAETKTAESIYAPNEWPGGWTEEAWTAFTGSTANRSALAIYQLATKLRDAITDHLNDHPQSELDILRAAGVPIPPAVVMADDYYRGNVRRHFNGVSYWLGEFTDAVGDVIPDVPVRAQPKRRRKAA